MTLEDVNGGYIGDLEDAVLAQLAFSYVKHAGEGIDGARERAREDLDSMSHTEFLARISLGIKELIERGLMRP